MPAQNSLCLCTAPPYHCSKEFFINPYTGKRTRGRWIPAPELSRHRHNQALQPLVSESPSPDSRADHNPAIQKSLQPPQPPPSKAISEILVSLQAQIVNHVITCSSIPISPSDGGPFPLASEEKFFLHTYHKLLSLRIDSLTDIETKLLERLIADVEYQLQRIETARATWKVTLRMSVLSKGCVPFRLDGIIDTGRFFQHPLQVAHPLVLLAMFLAVVLNLLGGVSHSSANFALQMIQLIAESTYQTILNAAGRELAERSMLSSLFDPFPLNTDIRTNLKKFDLEGVFTVYATCTTCHHCYPPSRDPESGTLTWPSTCGKLKNGRACKTSLLHKSRKEGKDRKVGQPIRPFCHYDLGDWLGGLLSRPGIEKLMDDSWKLLNPTPVMSDMMDGSLLRRFPGPDGKPFCDGPSGEGRYIFGLSVDWFCPFMNKQAGKKVSLGCISMVCMNLPKHLRWKPENMFLVGLIPGPREPPEDRINQYIAPLVCDLLDLWDPGMTYSRTADYPHGRRVRVALGPVICDSPAARKVVGTCAASHTVGCNQCDCSLKEYQQTGTRTWGKKTRQQYLTHAIAWRDGDDAERASIYKTYGIRWSPLLNLPYWDPTRFVVVDPMHNLFLGLIQDHFCILFGLKDNVKEDDRRTAKETTEANDKVNQGAKEMLDYLKKSPNPSVKHLMRSNKATLERACVIAKLRPVVAKGFQHTKDDLAKSLLQYILHPEAVIHGDITPGKRRPILGSNMTHAINTDLDNTSTPTWLGRPPPTFGSAAYGKLKADQWRTAGTITVPLTLISLWSAPHGTDIEQAMLVNFMDLVMAIECVSGRSISPQEVADHRMYLNRYFDGIRRLFPWFHFKPNQHAASHISDFLLSFGPMHGWWAYPFERMIGMIQKQKTNYHMGELELTLANSWVQMGNLRTFFERPSCPSELQKCFPILDRFYQSNDIRGTLQNDILFHSPSSEPGLKNGKSGRLDKDIYEALCQYVPTNHLKTALNNSAIHVPCFPWMGVMFTDRNSHTGNSRIMIRTSMCSTPAQIRGIFCHERLGSGGQPIKQMFFAVHCHLPISSKTNDPYLKYGAINTSLWQAKLSEGVHVITTDELICHFLCWPWRHDKKLIIARCLNRSGPASTSVINPDLSED